jgi:phosphoribosylaminoimidazole (AIR) synthetase
MLRTFNCGVGMVLIVSSGDVEKAKSVLASCGEPLIYDLGVLVEEAGVKVPAPLI